MEHSTSHSKFSVYLMPAAYALLNMAACLCALMAASFGQSLYHRSWNILYSLEKGFEKQFIYIIRVMFYIRKTNVDLSKTTLMVRFGEAKNKESITISVPATFFEGNAHNSSDEQQGSRTIKFLYIRDTELLFVDKIGITHDFQGGTINVSLVDLHESTKNEGYLAVLEKPVEALTFEEMEKKQMSITIPQKDMQLEGDFAITRDFSLLDFIGPLYLYFSILSYEIALQLIGFYADKALKPSYPLYNSYQKGSYFALGYFSFIFGLSTFISELTKFFLVGKPRSRFVKIFYFYQAVYILTGAIFAVKTVDILDADRIQFVLKDNAFIPTFLHIWAKSVIFAMGIGLFYCTPVIVTYLVFISLVFKKW